MRVNGLGIATCGCASVFVALVFGGLAGRAYGQAPAPTEEPVNVLVGRLDLEKYKATIKALTQFGDRLQGTDRNKAAIDWIEAQLVSYGCTPERLRYSYMPAPAALAQPAATLPRQIGTALVMELARIFSIGDVQTDRSIRFALWNNEEGGLVGSSAYVEQRAALQGKEDPPGSGRYPEPRWLGMIQHDMMLWDHGMPRADGTIAPEQRPEADVNIEFQSRAKLADQAMKLAFLFRDANEKYATDYPAAVGHHMTATDSTPFMDLVPSITSHPCRPVDVPKGALSFDERGFPVVRAAVRRPVRAIDDAPAMGLSSRQTSFL